MYRYDRTRGGWKMRCRWINLVRRVDVVVQDQGVGQQHVHGAAAAYTLCSILIR